MSLQSYILFVTIMLGVDEVFLIMPKIVYQSGDGLI